MEKLNTELFQLKEKTKITALKWLELTLQEQQLVLTTNAPYLDPMTKSAYISLISNASYYYFDRLGNIYTHHNS